MTDRPDGAWLEHDEHWALEEAAEAHEEESRMADWSFREKDDY